MVFDVLRYSKNSRLSYVASKLDLELNSNKSTWNTTLGVVGHRHVNGARDTLHTLDNRHSNGLLLVQWTRGAIYRYILSATIDCGTYPSIDVVGNNRFVKGIHR